MKYIFDFNTVCDGQKAGKYWPDFESAGDYRSGTCKSSAEKSACTNKIELPAAAYLDFKPVNELQNDYSYHEFTEPSKSEEEAVEEFENNAIAIAVGVVAVVLIVIFL